MSMTKKDYIVIAAIIDSAQAEHGSSDGLDDVAKELAAYFKRDNSRFDHDRFMEACGMEGL